MWQRNATRLRADVGLVERIHLSHWHHDHSGGLVRAVSMILAARRERPTTAGPMETLVADLHVDRPEVRGLKAPPRAAGEEYSVVSLEPDPSFDELTAQGAVIELSNQPHSVLDDMFLISGEIPRKTAYEKGIRGALRFSPGHPGPGRWEPDELIMDERFVVCHLKSKRPHLVFLASGAFHALEPCASLLTYRADKGLVVFTGCSHAGVVNVSRHAVHLAGGSVPLYAVVGGFHLADGSPDKLQATLDDLGALKPHVLIPGHCTGWRFKFKIEQEMAAVLVPCFSGTTYTLRSEP